MCRAFDGWLFPNPLKVVTRLHHSLRPPNWKLEESQRKGEKGVDVRYDKGREGEERGGEVEDEP